MEFIVGLGLGISATATRSASGSALVGLLILTAFSLAALVSPNGVSALALLATLAGLNVGIAATFLGALALR